MRSRLSQRWRRRSRRRLGATTTADQKATSLYIVAATVTVTMQSTTRALTMIVTVDATAAVATTLTIMYDRTDLLALQATVAVLAYAVQTTPIQEVSTPRPAVTDATDQDEATMIVIDTLIMTKQTTTVDGRADAQSTRGGTNVIPAPQFTGTANCAPTRTMIVDAPRVRLVDTLPGNNALVLSVGLFTIMDLRTR